MKIFVVGAGMYVTGRHGTGVGTILAALAQSSKFLEIERVDIIARSPDNAPLIEKAVNFINQQIDSSLKVRYSAVSSVSNYLKKQKGYDAAIIAVPDHLHYELGKIVLENDIHCLIVKPLTPSLTEGKDLVRIQNEKNLYAAVEFHKRFDESNLYVKRLISEGSLGEVRHFVINYSQRISIPLDVFKEWADQTNIFQYLGVHYVDLIYFLTGASPKSVMAVGTRGVLSKLGIATYDSVHAIVKWCGGSGDNDPFLSIMNIGWIDPRCTSALSDQGFTLVGSVGRMELDQKNRGIVMVKDGVGIQHINPYFAEFLPTANGSMEFQGYAYKSVRTFLEDVESLTSGQIGLNELEANRPSFKQALVSTAVVEAANISMLEDSRWVKVNDVT